MYCQNCGNELQPQAKFCIKCGQPIAPPVPVMPKAAPQPVVPPVPVMPKAAPQPFVPTVPVAPKAATQTFVSTARHTSGFGRKKGKAAAVLIGCVLVLAVIAFSLSLMKKKESVFLYNASNGQFRYSVYTDSVSITAFDADANQITADIPAIIENKPVTSIGDLAFVNCLSLAEVTIPDFVTSIGCSAFWGCTSLAEMTIPNSVTNIGGEAFDETPWLYSKTDTFVVVGDSILLDYNGSDSSVAVPDGIKSISSAFYNCSSLAEVTIP
ncbi:MAG: leucine-rich repeat protein, partial [Oscillospiraceae bacterium]